MLTVRVRCRDCGGAMQVTDGELSHRCNPVLKAMLRREIEIAQDEELEQILRYVGRVMREQRGA